MTPGWTAHNLTAPRTRYVLLVNREDIPSITTGKYHSLDHRRSGNRTIYSVESAIRRDAPDFFMQAASFVTGKEPGISRRKLDSATYKAVTDALIAVRKNDINLLNKLIMRTRDSKNAGDRASYEIFSVLHSIFPDGDMFNDARKGPKYDDIARIFPDQQPQDIKTYRALGFFRNFADNNSLTFVFFAGNCGKNNIGVDDDTFTYDDIFEELSAIRGKKMLMTYGLGGNNLMAYVDRLKNVDDFIVYSVSPDEDVTEGKSTKSALERRIIAPIIEQIPMVAWAVAPENAKSIVFRAPTFDVIL